MSETSAIEAKCKCGKLFKPRWLEPFGKFSSVCATCGIRNLDAFLNEDECESVNETTTAEQPRVSEIEQSFKIGDQWLYRGNCNSTWLFRNERNGEAGGLAEIVPKIAWPFLEEVARLRAALAQKETTDEASVLIKHQAEAWLKVATECVMLGCDHTEPGEVACDQIINFIKRLAAIAQKGTEQ